MKILTLILLTFILFGCNERSTYSEMVFPEVPSELKGCKFYLLRSESGYGIIVSKCKSATTTITSGKTTTAS